MSRFRRPPHHFRFPWRSRAQIHAEVEEELASHLAMRAEDLVRQGMRADEARARTEREFGDLGEACSRALWLGARVLE